MMEGGAMHKDCNGRKIKVGDKVEHVAPYGTADALPHIICGKPLERKIGFEGIRRVKSLLGTFAVSLDPPIGRINSTIDAHLRIVD